MLTIVEFFPGKQIREIPLLEGNILDNNRKSFNPVFLARWLNSKNQQLKISDEYKFK